MALKIVQEVMELIKTGTEAEVKKFVLDHWIDFPLELQDHLAVALMSDAINESSAALPA